MISMLSRKDCERNVHRTLEIITALDQEALIKAALEETAAEMRFAADLSLLGKTPTQTRRNHEKKIQPFRQARRRVAQALLKRGKTP